MSMVWKVVLGLTLILPLLAYVIGMGVAPADGPVQRPPIMIGDEVEPEPSVDPRDDTPDSTQRRPAPDDRRDKKRVEVIRAKPGPVDVKVDPSTSPPRAQADDDLLDDDGAERDDSGDGDSGDD
jgi:hypothetical protein